MNYVLSRVGKYTQLCDDSTEIAKAAITAEGNKNWTGNFVKEPQLVQVVDLNHYQNDQMNRVYSAEGISPTVMTKTGGVREIKIMDKSREIMVWDGYNQRTKKESDTVGTLTTNCGADLKRNGQGIIEPQLRIRKLTPKECYRLMAFSDADFEKASEVNSNAQLYKQAGNSIVVKVLEYIFLQMGIEKSWENSFTENFSLRG